MAIKFKEIRKYISKIDRISICMKETLTYNNYRYIKEVPNSYDECYLYGIGMIESEFEGEFGGMHTQDAGPDSEAGGITKPYDFFYCIEIMLSKTPRTNISLEKH